MIDFANWFSKLVCAADSRRVAMGVAAFALIGLHERQGISQLALTLGVMTLVALILADTFRPFQRKSKKDVTAPVERTMASPARKA